VMINNGVTYTYDAENRLVTPGAGNGTYLYDGDGNRMARLFNTSGTEYWRDLGGNPLLEDSNTGIDLREYIYFAGKKIARRDVRTNTVHFIFSDNLGSTSLVTDALGTMAACNGYTSGQFESDYYPYGGEMSICNNLGDQNYKFTGKERDAESGLDYFGARYNSTNYGRFMTPDWAAKPTTVPYANFGDPQSLNLYVYTRNNPTTLTDPNGHCTKNGEEKGRWWCFFNWSDQDEQNAAAQARKNLSRTSLMIGGEPASEWAKSASNKDVIAVNRQITTELLDEVWANLLGQLGPASAATVFLPTPGNMGTADFGQKVMKWGRGDAEARARIQTLTREELEKSGVTKDMAKAWRDFYENVKTANQGNPSAEGRKELMQRAYELLGGK